MKRVQNPRNEPHSGPVRFAAVAGTWYPGAPDALAAEVDRYVSSVPARLVGDVVALIVPHAGLMYSGAVAAYGYRQLAGSTFDVAVLIGPSHYVGFDGVAIVPTGEFETPLGPAHISEPDAALLMASSPVIKDHPAAHAREHSLEMQLPFLRRFLPEVPIVPLVMGYQARHTIEALADALVQALRGRRALLVASSDLSHYHDAKTAARLDAVVIDAVERFDPDGLQQALDRQPDHACGGGPMVSVLRAARELGGDQTRVLQYADSGDVSGDKSAVVGYLAAAIGRFETAPHGKG